MNIKNTRQKTEMIGLGVFATILEMSNSVAAQTGHVGKLTEAETFALPEKTEVRQAMRLYRTFL